MTADDALSSTDGANGVGHRARTTRATVMFADVVGFTQLAEVVGPERAYLAVTGALRLLDGIARRHGGSVDKYLGDSLLVVFGYPVPIVDGARAAANAAVEMREQVHEYSRGLGLEVPLDFVAGINTGAMVVGDIQSQVIREFHVLGDTVNVSARLKAKAPRGGIYVGPETHVEAGRAFEYRELGRMKFKGKDTDVAVFELLRSREHRSGAGLAAGERSDVAFVGRDHERALVANHLEGLAAGRGGVVVLLGEEGIGKSRLLAEAARPVADAIDVVHARATAVSQRRPGQLLLDVLLACEANDADLADAPDPPAVLATSLAERVVASVRARAGALPLLIALENLERADAASLEVLPTLVAALRGENVLIVMTLRPERGEVLDRLRSELALSGPVTELVLAPLPASESVQLVGVVAGNALLPDSLDLILARGAGNPARLVLATFLEPALRAERERSRHEHRSGDAERRRATILFADITGFTSLTERLGAERAYPIVAGCLRLLDETARRHGGTVEKYLGDCVMALFGVPEAIEDAPRAAVNAAIDMRRRVREYSASLGEDVRLDVHSGINTGLGIAGDISGPLIREFAVMGEPVSVADKLKDRAAAGEIYVGLEVYRATREVHEYRELDAVEEQDGRNAPVRAFALLSQQEHLHRARIGAERRLFSRLVGRDRELELLRGRLGSLRAGSGAIVSVIADAGLGKSRLLTELAASEEARGISWNEGRSVSTGQHLSFYPIGDLCRSWAGIDDKDDDESARAKLDASIRRVLPGEVDDVLPFFATLLGLRLDDAARARIVGLPADALENLTVRSVTQQLRAASQLRPLVVVMDDLHWADLSSIGLLERLLHLCEETPILFINLFRAGFEKTSERLRQQARAHHADHYLELELRPLDAAASRSLLNNLFRQGDIPQSTRQLIEEKAQGNPFYIEEVVRSLVDEGAVEFRDGSFRATDKIQTVVIPGTIQEVVMARVDALPPGRRQLLQMASVMGGVFRAGVLAEVLGERAGPPDALQALVEAEFLVPSERLPGEEYTFKYPLLQEVTYESLLHARREELHRQVGEAMERVLPPDVSGYAGMLAYHYSKGKVADRAEAFLFRAGSEAARAAASSEALHFFQEASKLYVELHGERGDPAKRALLEKNVAQALYYRGRFVEAIEHFNLALTHLGDRVVEARSELVWRFALNLVAVLARLYLPGRSRRPAAATPRQREIMELRYARAEATVTAQPTRHLFDSMDSLALLQRIDPVTVPGSGKLYAGAAALFAFGGISFDVSRRLSLKARTLVHEESSDDYLYERAMHFAYRVLEGDWADEDEIDPALIAECVRNGQLWAPTTYLGLLGEKRIHRGQFHGANACLEEIDRIRDLFQYDLAKTNQFYLRALIPLERGELEQAIEAADAYYDENPEDLLHILALGAKAKAQTLRGDLDEAERTLQHAVEVVARSSPVPPFHASAYHRSRFLLDVARLEQASVARDEAARRHWKRRARRSARDALRSAAKVAWRRAEVLRLAGRYHALLGQRRAAARFFARSVSEGERLGARPETARTYAEAGRWLLDAGRTNRRLHGLSASECLARARDTFGELDLAADLERLAGTS